MRDGLISVRGQEPTTIRSVVVNDGSPQRSRVASLTITFSTVVRFAGRPVDAFRLLGQLGAVRLKAETMLDATGMATMVRLTFASLADGRYRLLIDGDRIVDGSGAAVDGDRDGAEGGDAVETFFHLYGDSDGDGDGDTFDRFAFQSTRFRRFGNAGFLPYLDFDADADGRIDRHNVQHFRRKSGRST